MTLLLFFAFIAGLVTILAPCIWPLLPIVLSTSIGGGRAKSLGITLGIIISFAIYNLSISYLVRLFGFDPNALRYLAIVILLFLGLMMIIPPLTRIFEGLVSRVAGRIGQGNTQRQGFGGGFITGLSLGVIWTPCAGPILTAIATLSATAQVSFDIVLITIAYLIGVGIPLFAFSYGGQKLVANTRFLSPYTGWIQRIFGIILLLTALAIATNYDKTLQAKLLDYFPSYSNFLTSFEKNDTVKEELQKLKDQKQSIDVNRLNLLGGDEGLFNVTNNPVAPEFAGITQWLNLPAGRQVPDKPLTMTELRGKVVLVDFWTYTCINCIRTLPFVTSWYDKYKDQGFVVVGVHTPEFEFEKDTANVEDAINRFKIHYPVAQDNDFATWNAYSNQYWPAEYLIDAKGIIRRAHFGEGEYDKTEKAIQLLLKEAGKTVKDDMVKMPDQTPTSRLSPETYIGSRRMEFYFPSGTIPDGEKTFTLDTNPKSNSFSLGGTWTIEPEYSMTGNNATLVYNFSAQKVFLVMRQPAGSKTAQVRVYLDGKVIDRKLAGADVVNGVVTVDSDRLYELVNLKGGAENHILRLEFLTPGTEVYAFTFG